MWGVIMGIYYYAVDMSNKEYFSPPDGWSIKSPGIFHPENPFPGMVVMMNVRGYHFEIWNDCGNDIPPEEGYRDVTEEVYTEYCRIWPEGKNE